MQGGQGKNKCLWWVDKTSGAEENPRPQTHTKGNKQTGKSPAEHGSGARNSRTDFVELGDSNEPDQTDDPDDPPSASASSGRPTSLDGTGGISVITLQPE